jgi:hypothetical protein
MRLRLHHRNFEYSVCMQDLPCRKSLSHSNQCSGFCYHLQHLITIISVFKYWLDSVHNDSGRILYYSCHHLGESLLCRLESERRENCMHSLFRLNNLWRSFYLNNMRHSTNSLFNSRRTRKGVLYILPCGILVFIRYCYRLWGRKNCNFRFDFRWSLHTIRLSRWYCCIFCHNRSGNLPWWYLHFNFCHNLCSMSCRKYMLKFSINFILYISC